jgi:hypothetical protein
MITARHKAGTCSCGAEFDGKGVLSWQYFKMSMYISLLARYQFTYS